MALHGSSVPLDHGGFVVTVVCPNHYSHQRLMQALLSIVPDAGEPGPQPTMLDTYASRVLSAEVRDVEREDDTGEPYAIPGCATGACGLD